MKKIQMTTTSHDRIARHYVSRDSQISIGGGLPPKNLDFGMNNKFQDTKGDSKIYTIIHKKLLQIIGSRGQNHDENLSGNRNHCIRIQL